MDDLEPADSLEPGDLVILPGGAFGHAALVTSRIHSASDKVEFAAIFDCLSDGCDERALLFSKSFWEPVPDAKTIQVVRLKPNVPNREIIIHNVGVVCNRLTGLKSRIPYCRGPRQFARAILRRCFGNDDFSEAKEYYDLLLPFLLDKTQTINPNQMAFFCSRVVLLVYQIAVLFSYHGNAPNEPYDIEDLKPCFEFKPMYCRPSHVAELPDMSTCWTSFRVGNCIGEREFKQ